MFYAIIGTWLFVAYLEFKCHWGSCIFLCELWRSLCGLITTIVFKQEPLEGKVQPPLELLVERLLEHQVLKEHRINLDNRNVMSLLKILSEIRFPGEI